MADMDFYVSTGGYPLLPSQRFLQKNMTFIFFSAARVPVTV